MAEVGRTAFPSHEKRYNKNSLFQSLKDRFCFSDAIYKGPNSVPHSSSAYDCVWQ